MTSRKLHRLVALAASASLSLLPKAGRSQPEPRRELPVFGAGVSVVALPVFVTDRNGKAIQGLGADAFEIEDHGKKVRIVAFQSVDAEAPEPAPGAGDVTRAAARRQLLFLFDLTFSSVAGVQRARQSAMEFVEKGLARSDLAAVATFGSAGVKLLVGFTPDRAQLVNAIESLGATGLERPRDPLSLAYEIGFTSLEQRGGPAPEGRQAEIDDFFKQQVMLFERGEQRRYHDRALGFLSGLQQLAAALDAVQGRKQVILLSGGFDPTVLMGAQGEKATENAEAVARGRHWEVDSSSHFGDNVAQNRMQQLFTALAATDTVIHSVDVTGLAAGADLDMSGRAGNFGRGRESLAQLAINSGGRFVKDANNLGQALREVLDASRHYYILAFEPAGAGKKKGELRRLKVRVSVPGASVSHRAAYALPDVEAADPGRRQMQAAEIIAKGLSGGAIGLRVVAVPYRERRGELSIPLVLEIDGASLLEGGSKKAIQLQVYGYAFDGKGHIRDVLAVTPALDPAKLGGGLRQKGLQVLTSFRTAAGRNDLRFLVRDATTGRAGALRVEIDVPPFTPDRLALSPPLFMDDPRTRLVLPSPSQGNPQLEIPFRLEDVPFTLEARPVLRNGGARAVCLMSFMGPKYATESAFQITAELLDAAGRAQPLALPAPRIVRDADGFQRFVLSIEPKGVSAGDYELRVSFKQPGTSDVTARTQQAVRIE